MVKVVAAGAIPPLVSLLGSGNSAGVQEKALGALKNLAINSDNKVKIKAAGAIPLLEKLRDTGSNQVAAAAKGALGNLG